MRVRFGEMIREGPEKQPVVGSVCCDRSGFVRWIMKAEWVDGFEIRVTAEKGETVISANREGMLSLAKQLRMPNVHTGRQSILPQQEDTGRSPDARNCRVVRMEQL